MALSGSLLCLSTPLCSQPAAATTVAVERVKVHLLHNPKQHCCLFKVVPWIPKGFWSRGFVRDLVQVAATQANAAQGQIVEEGLSPNEPDGDEGGGNLPRKAPRRRRKTKRKVDEVTASSNVVGDEGAEAAAQVPSSITEGPSLESNSRVLEGLESPSDPGVDAPTGPKGSSVPSLTEAGQRVANGATGGAAILVVEELKQGPGVLRKKKRRSRKAKVAGAVTNGSVSLLSGEDIEAEQCGKNSDSTNVRSVTPKNAPEESVGSSTTEEPVALELTPSTSGVTSESPLGNGDDTSGQVTKKKKRRSKKKPIVELERRPKSELEEAESSLRSAADVSVVGDVAEDSTSQGSGKGGSEGQEHSDSERGSVGSETRKGRGRRKATGSQDQAVGTVEEAGNVYGGGRSDKELRTQASEESLAAGSNDHEDGLQTKVESKGTQNRDDSQKNSQSSLLTIHDKKANMPKGSPVNGTITPDSGDVQQNQIPSPGSEVRVATTSDDSFDPAKLAKKGKRRKPRKKKVSLQTESAQAEVIEQVPDNLYDSIFWCTVHLKVHAELEENMRLYVVGANPELGGWDLSQALPLPESNEEGFWENTLKIPRGTMLEYKYFTESQDTESTSTERWFGPEIQYFLPWKEGQGSESEVIRDTWVPDVPAKLPLLSWGDRWWEEIDAMNLGPPEGQDEEDQQIGSGKVFNREDQALDITEINVQTPAEEPVIEEWLKKKIRKKVFPREEPWLLESMMMEQRNGPVRKKIDTVVEGTEGGENPLAVEQKETDVQVEILINSPQCTMQRMAILEDGKLVELLLEPVNTRVQVGNVYLGVVRQLLPGMSGVFVDIGGFQLALLDITRNQYPYTFPSIGQFTDGTGGQSWSYSDDDEGSAWEEADSGDEEEGDDEDDVDGDLVDDEEGDEEELEEDIEDDASRGRSTHSKGRGHDSWGGEDQEARETQANSKGGNSLSFTRTDGGSPGPITVNFGRKLKKWRKLQEGMQIIVQVKKEALGKKGPRLTAFPSLAGRFWVLIPGGNAVGVSRRITGPERKRLRQLAQDLLPENFSLTVRTEALGHDREELEKDLARLMETWKEVLERASAAAVAAEHGMEGAMPVLLHRAMGQFLTIVRDFFNDKVHRMVIDSPQCYQEVTSYLQEVAPQLSDRVELYTEKMPIFDAFHIESEIEKFSSRRVSLPNGGYLVLEETEALVSIDVNGGTSVLSHDVSQEEAILAVNLAAARQIATELRVRDIGGIIVVDFIDMEDSKSEKMVLDEMRKAIARDRSCPSFSEISDFGLMEMTRKRVRPSVTLTISEQCSHCVGVGRVEAHETTLSKIERAVLRLLATRPTNGNTSSSDSTKWPQLVLRVDNDMCEYLKGRKRKRMTQLSAALKVWLNLKVNLEFSAGQFHVAEQQRPGSEKRPNGTKSQQNPSSGLLGRNRVWPGKRRRNFAAQVSTKE